MKEMETVIYEQIEVCNTKISQYENLKKHVFTVWDDPSLDPPPNFFFLDLLKWTANTLESCSPQFCDPDYVEERNKKFEVIQRAMDVSAVCDSEEELETILTDWRDGDMSLDEAFAPLFELCEVQKECVEDLRDVLQAQLECSACLEEEERGVDPTIHELLLVLWEQDHATNAACPPHGYD